jgi:hypothetical protein
MTHRLRERDSCGMSGGSLERTILARELVVQTPLRVVPEAPRRLASDSGGRVLSVLLPLKVPLERVQKQPIVRDREPERSAEGLISIGGTGGLQVDGALTSRTPSASSEFGCSGA